MSDGSRQDDSQLTDAMLQLAKRAFNKSRTRVDWAAEKAKKRLEKRQMKKDLDHFWVRLGKTAHNLVEAGEIDHPALRKAMVRIAELESQLDSAIVDDERLAKETDPQ